MNTFAQVAVGATNVLSLDYGYPQVNGQIYTLYIDGWNISRIRCSLAPIHIGTEQQVEVKVYAVLGVSPGGESTVLLDTGTLILGIGAAATVERPLLTSLLARRFKVTFQILVGTTATAVFVPSVVGSSS